MTTTERPRRTQAERRAETREKLLRATIELLCEQGFAKLTTAMVDERAGVSSGARVHHFPTKVDLVVAATALTYQEAEVLGHSRAISAQNAANPLREYALDCMSVYFDWPFVAALEVVVNARTDSALMDRLHPVLDRFHVTMRTTWIDTLVAAGYEADIAREELALTLNLIRGMAVNKIWQHDDAAYLDLLERWCAERAGRITERRVP